MTKNKHQRLAIRLADILKRLNDGERLTIKGLAEDFSVSNKTIQRDLRERLAFVDWVEEGPYYSVRKGNYGHLDSDDLTRIISFLSIKNIFPKLDRHFFLKYLTKNTTIKNIEYECIQKYSEEFDQLIRAIDMNRKIHIDYIKVRESIAKSYVVEPYHMINKNGIWYLIALDHGIEKTFCFTQISNIRLLEEWFDVDDVLLTKIKSSDSISHGNQMSEVVLQVSSEVASYFQKRQLLPHQEIVEIKKDGSLRIVCRKVHQMEVLPTIQYWLPHVEIVAPITLKNDLHDLLKKYLRLVDTPCL